MTPGAACAKCPTCKERGAGWPRPSDPNACRTCWHRRCPSASGGVRETLDGFASTMHTREVKVVLLVEHLGILHLLKARYGRSIGSQVQEAVADYIAKVHVAEAVRRAEVEEGGA